MAQPTIRRPTCAASGSVSSSWVRVSATKFSLQCAGVSPHPLNPGVPVLYGTAGVGERALCDHAIADWLQKAPQLLARIHEPGRAVRARRVPPLQHLAVPRRCGVVVTGGEERRAGLSRPTKSPRQRRSSAIGFARCRRGMRSGARGRPRPRGPSRASSCRPRWPSRGTSRQSSSRAGTSRGGEPGGRAVWGSPPPCGRG